jgi:hypothetical protein
MCKYLTFDQSISHPTTWVECGVKCRMPTKKLTCKRMRAMSLANLFPLIHARLASLEYRRKDEVRKT